MYVAISNRLLGDVEDNIEKMRRAEVAQVNPNDKKPTLSAGNPEIKRLLWGEHQALEHQLPNKWKREVQQLRVTLAVEVAPNEYSDFYAELAVNGTLYAPPDFVSYTPVKIGPDVCALYPEWIEWRAAVKEAAEIENRWRKVRDQVRAFLGKCKSLNEALKVMPAIALYVPQKYLDKIEQKAAKPADRSEVVDLTAEIDVDTITASAVTYRIGATS